MNKLVCIQFVLLLLTCVHCYPSGAPLSTCGSMLPGHHRDPIDSPPPFKITVESSDEETLKVTIVADESEHFKGFLLEARTDLDKEEAIGTWETDEKKTKTINCFGHSESAVTHFNHNDDDEEEDEEKKHKKKHFTKITFTWNKPEDFDDANIYFVATIVQKYHRIFMNVNTKYSFVKSSKNAESTTIKSSSKEQELSNSAEEHEETIETKTVMWTKSNHGLEANNSVVDVEKVEKTPVILSKLVEIKANNSINANEKIEATATTLSPLDNTEQNARILDDLISITDRLNDMTMETKMNLSELLKQDLFKIRMTKQVVKTNGSEEI